MLCGWVLASLTLSGQGKKSATKPHARAGNTLIGPKLPFGTVLNADVVYERPLLMMHEQAALALAIIDVACSTVFVH